MNVVDSSGWLEYFAAGGNVDFFAAPIQATEELIVPSICILQVARRVMEERGRDDALQVVAAMQQARVVDLDASLGLVAARLGSELDLPLADAVILATARLHGAVLWTQDSRFQGLPNVRYKPRRD